VANELCSAKELNLEYVQWTFSTTGHLPRLMKSAQCTVHTNGVRCIDRSTFTVPFCFSHLESHLFLTVKRTNLADPESGARANFLSLFVYAPWAGDRVVFRGERRRRGRSTLLGETVIYYVGEIITYEECFQRYGLEGATRTPDKPHTSMFCPYLAKNLHSKFTDCGLVRGVAALINTVLPGDIFTDGSKAAVNAKLCAPSNIDSSIRITARTNLYHDTEIFMNYDIAPNSSDHHETTPFSGDKNAYNEMKWKDNQQPLVSKSIIPQKARLR
jgi:hypothetical protein